MYTGFKIDDLSEECGLASTDLFSIPKICKDFKTSDYPTIPAALAALDESCNQPVEFAYKGTPNKYIDLSSSQINMTLQIVKKDGSRVPATAKMGPINFLGELKSL